MAVNGNTNGSWWLTALQTVGFPIVACMGFAWWSHTTIQWEREKMLPAIETNTEVLREVKQTLVRMHPLVSAAKPHPTEDP
jgi:hypothetical protein